MKGDKIMKKFGIYAIAEMPAHLSDVGIYVDDETYYSFPVLLVGTEAMSSDGEKILTYSVGNDKDIDNFRMALMEEQRKLKEMDKRIPDLGGGKKLYIYEENATAYRNIGYYAYTEEEAWRKFEKNITPDTLTDWDIDTMDGETYLSRIEEVKE